MALKTEINIKSLVVGDLNIPLSPIKENKALISTTTKKSEKHQNIYWIPTEYSYQVKEYAFYSGAHRSFSKIYHTLGHKANLYKLREMEIPLCILSDHNPMKPNITSKQIPSTLRNLWRLKQPLQTDKWVKTRSKKNIKTLCN